MSKNIKVDVFVSHSGRINEVFELMRAGMSIRTAVKIQIREQKLRPRLDPEAAGPSDWQGQTSHDELLQLHAPGHDARG